VEKGSNTPFYTPEPCNQPESLNEFDPFATIFPLCGYSTIEDINQNAAKNSPW